MGTATGPVPGCHKIRGSGGESGDRNVNTEKGRREDQRIRQKVRGGRGRRNVDIVVIWRERSNDNNVCNDTDLNPRCYCKRDYRFYFDFQYDLHGDVNEWQQQRKKRQSPVRIRQYPGPPWYRPIIFHRGSPISKYHGTGGRISEPIPHLI